MLRVGRRVLVLTMVVALACSSACGVDGHIFVCGCPASDQVIPVGDTFEMMVAAATLEEGIIFSWTVDGEADLDGSTTSTVRITPTESGVMTVRLIVVVEGTDGWMSAECTFIAGEASGPG